MATAMEAIDAVVAEIMRLHRSLPPRPSIEEVEAAKTLIRTIESEHQQKLEAIAKRSKPAGVPDELFLIWQEMERRLVEYQSKEERKEALEVLDLVSAHQVFDGLILRASRCVSDGDADFGGSLKPAIEARETSTEYVDVTSSKLYGMDDDGFVKEKSVEKFARDDTFVQKKKSAFDVHGMTGGRPATYSDAPQVLDATLRPAVISAQTGVKLSFMKLASWIEVSSKKGTQELNLRARLMDQVEWLPDSVGKLSRLVTLDLSENRLVTLPPTMGALFSLKKLDLLSNRITELPESIGDLVSLASLDVGANQLSRLPPSIGWLIGLEDLNLSSNQLAFLPEAIGSLVSLERLDVATNNLEELPHSIGQCLVLKELHLDYNRLRALPEAIGKIESLEVLTLRYNNARQLPTAMVSLTKLRELNVSFNELEAVPESLCFATSLVKLNVGNNFAVFRSLPRAIGNLEKLEELDISNNQIHVLPDSFGMLTQLSILKADQNPVEVPPKEAAEKGAQAVVQYMADLVAIREANVQPVKQNKTWAQMLLLKGY